MLHSECVVFAEGLLCSQIHQILGVRQLAVWPELADVISWLNLLNLEVQSSKPTVVV